MSLNPHQHQERKHLIRKKIRSCDPFVAETLSDIYEAFIDRGNRLTIEETCIKQSIDLKCSDEQEVEARAIEGILASAKAILDAKPSAHWDERVHSFYTMLHDIVFVKLRDEHLPINRLVAALLQLDYSQRIEPIKVANRQRNIYNYLALSLESITQKMAEATVSTKAVNNLLSHALPTMGVIVTDQQWRIRFTSSKASEWLGVEHFELLGESVLSYFEESDLITTLLARDGQLEKRRIALCSPTGNRPMWLSIHSDNIADYQNGEAEEVPEYVLRLEPMAAGSISRTSYEDYQALTTIDTLIEQIDQLEANKSDQTRILHYQLEKLYHLKEKHIKRILPDPEPPVSLIDGQTLIDTVLADIKGLSGIDDIIFDLQVDHPILLYGDRDALVFIIRCLVSNSIKYRNKARKSPLVAITISGTAQGHTRIQVSDNGIGIPVHYQDRIFEKGFRIPCDPQEKAYGLGLYYANCCALEMGASLRVISQPGQGSTFELLIPR